MEMQQQTFAGWMKQQAALQLKEATDALYADADAHGESVSYECLEREEEWYEDFVSGVDQEW